MRRSDILYLTLVVVVSAVVNVLIDPGSLVGILGLSLGVALAAWLAYRATLARRP